jgi:hypothetical protein
MTGPLFDRIASIRESNPDNLMARYFSETFYRNLAPLLRHRLDRIIASGLENPDSRIGLYAMYSEDYDLFRTVLEPIALDYHAVPVGRLPVQVHKPAVWDASALVSIISWPQGASLRLRLARNLTGFPLPGDMSKEQRLDLEKLVMVAVARLQREPAFAGGYVSLTPELEKAYIGDADHRRLVKAQQIFAQATADRYQASAGITADWPHGCGIYVSQTEDFSIWVGEEDHLRVISTDRADNPGRAIASLHAGLEFLRAQLPAFAHSPRYGYLTSCPTNLGTSLRASLHLRLPRLTSSRTNLIALKKTNRETRPGYTRLDR